MDQSPSSFADFMRNNDPENSRLTDDGDGDSDGDDDDGSLIGSTGLSERQQQQQQQQQQPHQYRLGITGVAAASALPPTAAVFHKPEDEYFRQNTPAATAAATMVAIASTTSSHRSSSNSSEFSHRQNILRHQHQHEPQRKNPPSYQHNSRANLKNDLSYSYQQSNREEAISRRNLYSDDIHRQIQMQQQQPHQHEVENPSTYQRHPLLSNGNNAAQNNYLLQSNDDSHSTQSSAHNTTSLSVFDRKASVNLSINHENFEGKPLSAASPTNNGNDEDSSNSIVPQNQVKRISSGNDHSSKRPDPRPLSRPGKPPPPSAKAIEPKIFAPRLGRRGLSLRTRLLSSPPSQQQAGGAGGADRNSQGSTIPGGTIRVECVRCKNILEGVPRNGIAVECPRCRKFQPTVTCRVMQ